MLLPFKKWLGLFIVLGLSACTVQAQHNASKIHNRLEPLYGIQMGQDNITIQVKSNGCTRSEHFKFKINSSTTETPLQKDLKTVGETELTIQRLGSDHCRRMPFLLSVKLPLPDIQGPFKLMNPLQIWRTKKRQ